MERIHKSIEVGRRYMYLQYNIILYGEQQECEEVITLLKINPILNGKKLICSCINEQEELQMRLVDGNRDLVIVLADGAKGMEGVYTVKEHDRDLAVFWFSNDRNFAVQSHRLDCTYFAVKPLTEKKLTKAFEYCDYIGINNSY